MFRIIKIAFFTLLIIALVSASAPTVCFANSPKDGAVSYDTIQINVPFVSLGHKQFSWDFPWSDGYFTVPSENFSIELAQASMGLTVSAFRYDNETLDNQYETYLKAAGFTAITPFGYDKPTSADTLAGVIAYKQIEDFILIAAAPCGQGYGSEWGGNMLVGNGTRHEGFDNAAKILEKNILQFIESNNLKGDLKLWVTGFSRASAVGNITAADMIDSGRFEDVYAYLFGVPRTTRKPVYYNGIFNICGKYDPVTTIPLQSWGFDRYGFTFFTPAEEMDVEYQKFLYKASEVSLEMTGNIMRNNPEVNYQLHMIIEFLGEMFPTTEEYTEKFQSILVRTMSGVTIDNVLETLLSAVKQLEKLDSRQTYSSDVLYDYLSYIISQHTAEEQEQVSKGWWDPDRSIGENLMREHMPLTYICWLFSENAENDLVGGPAFTKMIVVDADADVEVLWEGQLIGGARRDGSIIDTWDLIDLSKYETYAEIMMDFHSICAIRNGTRTVLNIPMNDRFTIGIRTYGVTNVVYYDVTRTSHMTYGTTDKMHVFVADEGEYRFDASYADPLSDLTVISGRASNVRDIDYVYSTTVLMADEAGNSRHISIKTLLQIIFFSAVFVLLLIVFCAVVRGIHRHGQKKYGKTYSVLWVIIPHIILIALFAMLTLLFTVNLFSIGTARSLFAGLTVLVIFLLALRGTLRRRTPYNTAVSVFLLLAAFTNVFVYQRSALVSSSPLHSAVYCAAMLILTALAVSTFAKKKQVI